MDKEFKIKTITNILSIISVAVSFLSLAMAGLGFSRNYFDMAIYQRILVTLDQTVGILLAIFFMLLALYLKKDN